MASSLFKIKTIFVRYKSHLILAVVVAVISFVLGHIATYDKDLNWVYRNKANTEEYVNHTEELFNLQREIYLNFKEAYDKIATCLNNQTCNPETEGKELDNLQEKRSQMIIKLNELNMKTDTLLKKMGF